MVYKCANVNMARREECAYEKSHIMTQKRSCAYAAKKKEEKKKTRIMNRIVNDNKLNRGDLYKL